MMRRASTGVAVCLLMLVAVSDGLAQTHSYEYPARNFAENQPRPRPSAAELQARRFREAALAKVGPVARNFVDAEGDAAVAAIFACSAPVGAKLALFYSSGKLRKLPRPHDLLCIIGRPGNGDQVALFAIGHASALVDPDSFDAFLMNPHDYMWGLKALGAATRTGRVQANAAEASEGMADGAKQLNRATPANGVWASLGREGRNQLMGIIVSVLLGGGCLVWHYRKSWLRWLKRKLQRAPQPQRVSIIEEQPRQLTVIDPRETRPWRLLK